MTYFAFALALGFAIALFIALAGRRHDQTKQSEKQHQLQEDNQRLRKSHDRNVQRLLDAFPDPFFSINAEREIVRLNQPALEHFPGRDIASRPIREIFLSSELLKAIDRAMDSSQAESQVIQFSANSPFSSKALGKESHWEVDIRPLSLSSNQREVQLMMRDITTGVHADQVRQDFVANASHELRTPLSIISGYLENLTEEGGLDNKKIAQKMLSTMDRHVDRINRIVEDMLVISKLESADAAPIAIEPFNLAVCVRDVVERLDLVIEKQKADVSIKVPDITLAGDRFYWTQVLFNLVENALKQNASLPVKIKVIAKETKYGEVVLKVTDNGIGIPSADLPFIFKRFFRVEKHHSQSDIKGTGLGLSIVKRAVEAHGGSISATSTPGVETTFTIIVPRTLE